MAIGADTQFIYHASAGGGKYPDVQFYLVLKNDGDAIADLLKKINSRGISERKIAERLGYSRGYIAAIKQGRRRKTMTAKTYNQILDRISIEFHEDVAEYFNLEDFVTWTEKTLEAGCRGGLAKAVTPSKRDFTLKTFEGRYKSGIAFHSSKTYHEYYPRKTTHGTFISGKGRFPE